MSEKNYDYEIEYAIDREGSTETLLLNDIPYDIFKAAKPHFIDSPEKALRLIINDVADDKGKVTALKHLSDQNLVAIQSLESGIAGMVTAIPAQIKKKSKVQKSSSIK